MLQWAQRLRVVVAGGNSLPTGPKANLFKQVRSKKVLLRAWQVISSNAQTSRSWDTRKKAEDFAQDIPRNLRKLQDRLRTGYQFEQPQGLAVSKGPGKTGRRPLVVAPLEDRIVRRAILEVLQGAKWLEPIQLVLATPTSIGGIPGRGVDDAIRLIDKRFAAEELWIAGSDISGFFTKIRKSEVIDFVRGATGDDKFSALFEAALSAEINFAHEISFEERKLFPSGDFGVAQGCPLSALAGNIVLRDFDRQLNGRGVTCIRYIDDFILIARKQEQVVKAMESAKEILTAKSMEVYDYKISPDKAFFGRAGKDKVFLGYELNPGEYAPSRKARERLLSKVEAELDRGRRSIERALEGKRLSSSDRAYVDTLYLVNGMIEGWRGSFGMAKARDILGFMDQTIDQLVEDFDKFYRDRTVKSDMMLKRRALGVALVGDLKSRFDRKKPKKS